MFLELKIIFEYFVYLGFEGLNVWDLIIVVFKIIKFCKWRCRLGCVDCNVVFCYILGFFVFGKLILFNVFFNCFFDVFYYFIIKFCCVVNSVELGGGK